MIVSHPPSQAMAVLFFQTYKPDSELALDTILPHMPHGKDDHSIVQTRSPWVLIKGAIHAEPIGINQGHPSKSGLTAAQLRANPPPGSVDFTL